MGYLPLLPIVFDTPLSPFLRCFHIFVALPPFLNFLEHKEPALCTSDKKHVEFWHLKVTSFRFKIQDGHQVKSRENAIIQ